MQNSFFDGTTKYKITKPIRLIELFAGIGSQRKALKNLKADATSYRVCEYDKYAIQSYNAIHGTNFKPSSINDWTAKDLGITEPDKYTYLMTYSFPCQDLSLAGNQKGMARGDNTRSGLLWEVERLLDECNGNLPDVLLMENVPQVIGAKNIEHFAEWLAKLDSLGYKSKWELLNAKNYGIPQNRNRCFMVSIKGDYYYDFPKPMPLKLRLKDMLEDEVNEKYYLIVKQIAKIAFLGNKPYIEKGTGIHQSNTIQTKDIINTLTAGDYKATPMIIEPKCIKVADLNIPGRMESACRVYSPDGIAPACNTCGGGGLETKIMEEQETSGIIYEKPLERKGWHNKACEVLNPNGITTCIHTQSNNLLQKIKVDYRIRKLTPKECWRLMGFTDESFDKAKQSGMSNSQLYKQAGNSIVVNVLEAIFKEIL